MFAAITWKDHAKTAQSKLLYELPAEIWLTLYLTVSRLTGYLTNETQTSKLHQARPTRAASRGAAQSGRGVAGGAHKGAAAA